MKYTNAKYRLLALVFSFTIIFSCTPKQGQLTNRSGHNAELTADTITATKTTTRTDTQSSTGLTTVTMTSTSSGSATNTSTLSTTSTSSSTSSNTSTSSTTRTGFDINGVSTSCPLPNPSLICTRSYEVGDQYGADCSSAGGTAIYCACHKFLCSKKLDKTYGTP